MAREGTEGRKGPERRDATEDGKRLFAAANADVPALLMLASLMFTADMEAHAVLELHLQERVKMLLSRSFSECMLRSDSE